jgi:hypothetical protein
LIDNGEIDTSPVALISHTINDLVGLLHNGMMARLNLIGLSPEGRVNIIPVKPLIKVAAPSTTT